MRYIYVLSTCNEWKEWSSMETILVTTSIRKVRKEIKSKIEKGEFEIGNDNTFNYLMSGNLPPKLFESELNNILDYGYLEVWED